ncbi:hypothetical protein BE15_24740 [Sorangium cellulosum]|uniref:Uncharacterized protein n=1 Tax=Sorangium cellulosum TaxID=56 RepID=A0A150Q296_SORCE|nr:hypothetical protein BE15_24740 [Sorangium cellulosum]
MKKAVVEVGAGGLLAVLSGRRGEQALQDVSGTGAAIAGPRGSPRCEVARGSALAATAAVE